MARKTAASSLESQYRDLSKRSAMGDKDAQVEKGKVITQLYGKAGRKNRLAVKAFIKDVADKI